MNDSMIRSIALASHRDRNGDRNGDPHRDRNRSGRDDSHRVRRCVGRWLALAMVCVSTCKADEPETRFWFADGSQFVGQLEAADVPGQIRIRSRLFSHPMDVSVNDLLEGRSVESTEIESDHATGDLLRFAFTLVDGSQLLGTVGDWTDHSVTVETEALGRVTFQDQDVVSLVEQKEMPTQIALLANSRFRFRHETGWSVTADGLRCDVPEAATVADYELPDRFRLRLEVGCDGDADFELSLGDRSSNGAGQGSGRVDRRGGSLSRLPTERFVTRLEWVGDSVSVVRSNASVSDAAVFHLPDRQGQLEIDLYCDQTDGRLIATCDGLLVADVALQDEAPVMRSVLTLISRRDPVDVTALDLFEWDGEKPRSQLLPERLTLLRDGTLIEDVADRWEQQRFQLGGTWYGISELSRMRFADARYQPSVCELMLNDGTRIRGQIEATTGQPVRQGDDQASARLLVHCDAVTETVAIDPRRVRRVVGRATALEPADAPVSQCVSEGVRLRGQLIDGRGLGTAFGWRPAVGQADLGIAAEQGLEIQLGGAERREDLGQIVASASYLELRSGDRLSGDLIASTKEGVRFLSDFSGEVVVALEHVSRIGLQPGAKFDASDLQLLLSLPRQMQDSPPTHLLVSVTGDVLRGRLLSIDAQQARIEVRGRTRLVERGKIAQIIWLDQKSPAADNCRYVVTTDDGGQLGLQTGEFNGTELAGKHSVLGDCRIGSDKMVTLRFGDRPSVVNQKWELIPVKEPKTFE